MGLTVRSCPGSLSTPAVQRQAPQLCLNTKSFFHSTFTAKLRMKFKLLHGPHHPPASLQYSLGCSSPRSPVLAVGCCLFSSASLTPPAVPGTLPFGSSLLLFLEIPFLFSTQDWFHHLLEAFSEFFSATGPLCVLHDALGMSLCLSCLPHWTAGSCKEGPCLILQQTGWCWMVSYTCAEVAYARDITLAPGDWS